MDAKAAKLIIIVITFLQRAQMPVQDMILSSFIYFLQCQKRVPHDAANLVL